MKNMQIAANDSSAPNPSRDIDTIVLEARHLLGTSKPLEPGKRRIYPSDPVTIAKVLALRVESGLARERFCERVYVGPATLWCWEQGQTGGGKPWPALFTILQQKTTAALRNALEMPSSWEILPSAPSDLGKQPPRLTDAVGQAAKRLEGLSPPVVGVAFPTPQIAPKIVDDRPTAEDLLASIRTTLKVQGMLRPTPQHLAGAGDAVAICGAPNDGHSTDNPRETDCDACKDTLSLGPDAYASNKRTGDRIKGAEVVEARDSAYAAYQAALDRMPAAEAAADLVVAYRRSHRGLPGFCRGHYDAETMAKRLEQWTAGCDEDGEQWDRLIGLLSLRGVKPSKNGLGKRTAKAQRRVEAEATQRAAAGDRLYASAKWQHAANNPPSRHGMYMGHEQGDPTDRYPVRWTKSGWRSPNGTSLFFGSPGRDDMWCEIVISRPAVDVVDRTDLLTVGPELARPVTGFVDLEDRFSLDKDEAIARSWDIQVERAAQALISHAVTSNASLHVHLTSDTARDYVTALSRMLEGREAHRRTLST